MRRSEGIWGAVCAGGGNGDNCALYFFVCSCSTRPSMPYLGTAAALVVCPPPRVICIKTPSSTAAPCVGGRLRRRRDSFLLFLGPPPSRRSCLGGGDRATAFLLPFFFGRSPVTAGFSGRVAWSSGCGGARRRPQRRRPGGAGVRALLPRGNPAGCGVPAAAQASAAVAAAAVRRQCGGSAPCCVPPSALHASPPRPLIAATGRMCGRWRPPRGGTAATAAGATVRGVRPRGGVAKRFMAAAIRTRPLSRGRRCPPPAAHSLPDAIHMGGAGASSRPLAPQPLAFAFRPPLSVQRRPFFPCARGATPPPDTPLPPPPALPHASRSETLPTDSSSPYPPPLRPVS